MPEIAPLRQEDLPELAAIHVRIWQQAYAGQMPQDFLDTLDPAQRLKGWQEGFNRHKGNPEYGAFLARVDEKAAGFISYGPARDGNSSIAHEIYAVYLLQEYWSQGIGWKMFDCVAANFRARGIAKAYLWVLATNRKALGAYARWGGRIEKDVIKVIMIGGSAYPEYRVTFDL